MKMIEDYVDLYGEKYRKLIETNLDILRDVPEEFRLKADQRDKFIDNAIRKAQAKE